MKVAKAHTAVLLFTRTSSEEARVKKFTSSTSRNKAIITQLINRTKLLVRQAGFPLIVIDSTRQRGETFGERLQHAIQQVLDAGYEHVICLGNDSPELTPRLLQLAAAKLQQQDFVFGEALDGGVYLMGMRRATFTKLNFAAVSWQTAQVFQELVRQTALNRVTVLTPILVDADHRAAVQSISNTVSLGRFSRILQALLPLEQPSFARFISLLLAVLMATPGWRAPPEGM